MLMVISAKQSTYAGVWLILISIVRVMHVCYNECA
jgi:hypothetical protein